MVETSLLYQRAESHIPQNEKAKNSFYSLQFILKIKKTAKKTTFEPDPGALEQIFFDHDDEVAN